MNIQNPIFKAVWKAYLEARQQTHKLKHFRTFLESLDMGVKDETLKTVTEAIDVILEANLRRFLDSSIRAGAIDTNPDSAEVDAAMRLLKASTGLYGEDNAKKANADKKQLRGAEAVVRAFIAGRVIRGLETQGWYAEADDIEAEELFMKYSDNLYKSFMTNYKPADDVESLVGQFTNYMKQALRAPASRDFIKMKGGTPVNTSWKPDANYIWSPEKYLFRGPDVQKARQLGIDLNTDQEKAFNLGIGEERKPTRVLYKGKAYQRMGPNQNIPNELRSLPPSDPDMSEYWELHNPYDTVRGRATSLSDTGTEEEGSGRKLEEIVAGSEADEPSEASQRLGELETDILGNWDEFLSLGRSSLDDDLGNIIDMTSANIDDLVDFAESIAQYKAKTGTTPNKAELLKLAKKEGEEMELFVNSPFELGYEISKNIADNVMPMGPEPKLGRNPTPDQVAAYEDYTTKRQALEDYVTQLAGATTEAKLQKGKGLPKYLSSVKSAFGPKNKDLTKQMFQDIFDIWSKNIESNPTASMPSQGELMPIFRQKYGESFSKDLVSYLTQWLPKMISLVMPKLRAARDISEENEDYSHDYDPFANKAERRK